MRGRPSLVWLGLTPEPERELPSAVATLRAPPTAPAQAQRPPPPTAERAALAAAERQRVERQRVERLILHGTQRGWLRYLAEVTQLVAAVADGSRPGDPAVALLVGEVVLDHHSLLIGLPGTGYAKAAEQRSALDGALRTLRARTANGGEG